MPSSPDEPPLDSEGYRLCHCGKRAVVSRVGLGQVRPLCREHADESDSDPAEELYDWPEPPFPERRNYGCVNCGSINHTTGDVNWCPKERESD